jgi:guanylate kinase
MINNTIKILLSFFLIISITSCAKNDKNFAIIISGPSGVGKTTLANKLIAKHQNCMVQAISATTRSPRNNEINDKDYHFITHNQFKELIAQNAFFEYVKNFDNFYGTLKSSYFEALKNKKDVVFILDSSGFFAMKRHSNIDMISIFIAPPSYEKLKERLENRKTENKQIIEKRLSSAKKEIAASNEYDYIVYNYDIDNSVKIINSIYMSEKYKRIKNSKYAKRIN